ncbi:LamG-like jellyroll fold domain-containing protein [Flavobacterium sp.]|jgi:hypothetical protein|uniref:LamG-like jellyroll fold domain-containing protein n=1 Tax=Flavobacterium sp. TaxID=239 RepID=UPI0037C0EAC2
MKNKLLLLVFGLVMTTQMIFAQSWITRPNLPSTDRTAVGSFAIGSKGYYIGGETSSSGNLVDTWEYDTSSNTWSQKANYPGTGTQKGVAFSINGVGYYGLGTAGGQLYSYNSQNNTWTQKATCNLTGISFWSTTYFVVGTNAYFLDQNNKFFTYDAVANSWSLLSDFTGTKRVTGVGFSINNKGYICTGLNATSAGNTMLNDLWEYNPSNSTWTQKTALPSAGRYASFGFAFNNKGYVLGGERNSGVMLNEFWEYNPTTDSWSSLPNYIGGAKNYLSGFVANNSVYAGFGSPGFGVTFNEYGFFNQSSSFCTSLSGSLTNGLMGYWPFCGNANDDSGNGNNGTVNGATLTTDRFGNTNSAYNFDGVNDYISTNYSGILGTNSRSISFWYNSNSNNIEETVFTGYGENNCGAGFACTLFPLNKPAVDNTCSWIKSVNSTTINSWNLYTITYTSSDGSDLTNCKIYINGVLQSTSQNSTLYNINTINGINMVFGSSILFYPNQFFNGKLDDIGIWNRALTQQEITQLYNQNQCITNITVTDTLIINVGQMSYTNPVAYANNITIYPNPASTQININFNNITDLTGGTVKIINSLGQQVATTPITLTGTSTSMALSSWGGNGVYFVQILNAQGIVVDVKKIILQ